MFAVTAVAAHKNTGAPEYFLVQALADAQLATPRIDTSNPGVVYSRDELVELLEAYGNQVVAFLPGVTPQPLRTQFGTHGFRFIETFHNGEATNLLRKLPTFAFVREARLADFTNLFAIDGLAMQPPVVVPAERMQRYIENRWVQMDGERPRLTAFGKALLAYGGGRRAKPATPPE